MKKVNKIDKYVLRKIKRFLAGDVIVPMPFVQLRPKSTRSIESSSMSPSPATLVALFSTIDHALRVWG